MYKNIFIIVFLVLGGCGGPQHREIMVNKTVKVFSEEYHDQAENYIFKWKPPIGPSNENIIFDLKNDMLIFTPETVGNYEVNLSVEDISDQVVANEIFYFRAVPETTEIAIIEPKKESPPPPSPAIAEKKPKKELKNKSHTRLAKKQGTRKPSKPNKQHPNTKITPTIYAIQISAWPSLEEARHHQLELIDKGFDAYIQNFYFQKKAAVWYRVRVGNFINREKALKVKKQIESITGITTWLDILSIK